MGEDSRKKFSWKLARGRMCGVEGRTKVADHPNEPPLQTFELLRVWHKLNGLSAHMDTHFVNIGAFLFTTVKSRPSTAAIKTHEFRIHLLARTL